MKTNARKLLLISSLPIMIAAAASAQTSPTPTQTPVSPTPSPSLSPSTTPAPGASPGTWDPFADMQRMQSDMNQFFSRAMNELGMNQAFLTMRNEPGFASSIDVRDKGDHYEVHAFLPNRQIDSVKVATEGNNRLRIIASSSSTEEKKAGKTGEMVMQEWGAYEQLVTLPGPANTKQMKVDRKEHEIVISVPKLTKS